MPPSPALQKLGELKILWKVIFDIVIFCVVFLPFVLILWGDVLDPPIRGFFCNDESIRYPLKKSTVSTPLVLIASLSIPSTVMVVTEAILAWKHPGKPLGKIPYFVVRCYGAVGTFLLGCFGTYVLTDIGKLTIGRLRPYFYNVCRPIPNCTEVTDVYTYIDKYTCQETNRKKVKESRLSFPSGHSSFSAFCMIYLVLYIQSRVNVKGCFLLKRLAQLACVGLTWFTALSRVHDYKHHWSDVCVGLLFGTTGAIMTAFFVSDLFKPVKPAIVNPKMSSFEEPTSSGVRSIQLPHKSETIHQPPQSSSMTGK